jgi:hypothetical protein
MLKFYIAAEAGDANAQALAGLYYKSGKGDPILIHIHLKF